MLRVLGTDFLVELITVELGFPHRLLGFSEALLCFRMFTFYLCQVFL